MAVLLTVLILQMQVVALGVPRLAEAQSLIGCDILEQRAKINGTYARGINWSTKYVGNKCIWSSEPIWLWSPSEGRYVPYIVIDRRVTDNYIQVQSSLIGARLYPTYTVFYDPNMTEVRVASEQWFLLHWNPTIKGWRDASLTNFRWTIRQTSDYVEVVKTYDTTYSVTAGTLNITFRFEGSLKHTIEWFNKTQTFMKPRIEQYWTGINADFLTTNLGDLSLLAVSTVNKTYTDFIFRKADGSLSIFESQASAIQQLNYSSVETAAGDKKVRFVFANLTYSMRIDPATYTSSNPTEDGIIMFDAPSGANFCQATSISKSSTGTRLSISMPHTGVVSYCYRSYGEWDITSIPDSSTVVDVDFKFHVETDNTDGDPTVDATKMNTRPSTSTATQIFYNYSSSYVTLPNGAGTNKLVDLGSTADSDLQSQLSSNWFAIGIKFSSESRGLYNKDYYIYSEEYGGTPNPTLEVTYTLYSLNLNVFASDGSTVASSITKVYVTMNNGTAYKRQVSSGWANFTGITKNTNVTVTVQIFNSTNTNGYRLVNQSNSVVINVTDLISNRRLWISLHDIGLQAQGISDSTLSDIRYNITLSNSTLLSNKNANSTGYYRIGWVGNGSMTITTFWQSNINVNNSLSYTPTASATLTINTLVYRQAVGSNFLRFGADQQSISSISYNTDTSRLSYTTVCNPCKVSSGVFLGKPKYISKNGTVITEITDWTWDDDARITNIAISGSGVYVVSWTALGGGVGQSPAGPGGGVVSVETTTTTTQRVGLIPRIAPPELETNTMITIGLAGILSGIFIFSSYRSWWSRQSRKFQNIPEMMAWDNERRTSFISRISKRVKRSLRRFRRRSSIYRRFSGR